jgi:EAL domain-containing protein (putative c-di-GMP-specific phosphodiesterase class I)
MTRALASFAQSIGSAIIAEGIERPEERDTLIDLGVEFGQGFLLGRPAASFLPPAHALSAAAPAAS